MKFVSLLSLALLGAVTAHGAAVNLDVDKNSVDDVIRSLKRDPEGGFKHVADDGVVRSYSAEGKVIDAARLTNAQLLQAAAHHTNPEDRKHLEEVWQDVHGFDVPEEQLYAPAEHLLPRALTDETLSKELQQKEAEHLAARGQSKIEGVLSPNVNCRALTCNSWTFCHLEGCSDCVQYDYMRGNLCT
ncbi:hypothetical protein GX50_02866 [[Emmonsia] crescens]|uniref:Uncharacterized protein n=1 Tax=[Emmonsia] crescens TaxID=73230 RepID=A0A2B7ZM89_9EURO|nr:hypothetical protein GX50_02866 [Emmonsia crescens]